MYTIPFRYRQATAKLVRLDLGIYEVRNVWSQARRLGDGTGVMQKVIDYADKNGLVLILRAQRYGHPQRPMLDNAQLEKWYAKFGFESQFESDRPRMIRYPRKVSK